MAITLTDGEKLIFAATYGSLYEEYKAAWWRMHKAAADAMRVTLIPSAEQPPLGTTGYWMNVQKIREVLLSVYAGHEINSPILPENNGGYSDTTQWAAMMANAAAVAAIVNARGSAAAIATANDILEGEAPDVRDMLAQIYDIPADPP